MTNEQITQLFEKHSHPNNDFEPVWMMNEADFATAIREAIEQASQPVPTCAENAQKSTQHIDIKSNEACTEKQASRPQWIPVSERLPDDSKRVLVSIVCQSGMEDSDPLIKTAWFDLDDECWLEDMPPFGKVEAFDTWKITHWMPLPNDPKSA